MFLIYVKKSKKTKMCLISVAFSNFMYSLQFHFDVNVNEELCSSHLDQQGAGRSEQLVVYTELLFRTTEEETAARKAGASCRPCSPL